MYIGMRLSCSLLVVIWRQIKLQNQQMNQKTQYFLEIDYKGEKLCFEPKPSLSQMFSRKLNI